MARKLKQREAGTILLGNLNTHEYGYGVTNNNPHQGADPRSLAPCAHPGWRQRRFGRGDRGGDGHGYHRHRHRGQHSPARVPVRGGGVQAEPRAVSKAGVLPLPYLFDQPVP